MGEENDEKKLQEDLRLKNDATKTRFFLSLGISYDTCGRRKSPEEGLGGGGEDEEGVDEVVMRVREMKRGKARIAGFISISFSA